MTEFVVNDEFEDSIDEQVEEVNTSYDQDQVIGDEPQALNTELSGSEPIDAMTGQDFYDIQKGGQAPRVQEYKTVWNIISGEANPNHADDGKFSSGIGDTFAETQEWVAKKISEYGSKNDFTSSDEYKQAYPEIMKIYNKEKKERGNQKTKDGVKAMNEIGAKFGDHVFYDSVSSFGNVGTFEGIIKKDKFGAPVVKLDGERKSIQWHKGFKKFKGESLNKDGTGVARATRGINPNNPKYDLMKFIYVSSSDCPICKQYDGKVFHKDDPDRPIIPRLESGYSAGKGYAGSNYTHPHCKCKWTYVFREAKSNEFEMDNPEPFARAAKMAYDKLERAKENDKPLDEWTKDDLYKSECQMCGSPLDEHPNVKDQESHEFMPEYPTDYEGDMSPANEGGNGSGKNGHQRWMLGAEVGQECENCMMITEYKDGKCMICSN